MNRRSTSSAASSHQPVISAPATAISSTATTSTGPASVSAPATEATYCRRRRGGGGGGGSTATESDIPIYTATASSNFPIDCPTLIYHRSTRRKRRRESATTAPREGRPESAPPPAAAAASSQHDEETSSRRLLRIHRKSKERQPDVLCTKELDAPPSTKRKRSSRRDKDYSEASTSKKRNAGHEHRSRVSPQFDPKLFGVPVRPHVRKAGPYLLGPRLGTSPVKSIVQCLARNKDSDKYYLIKMLTLSGVGETQDERHGKMLLHTEHSLLSLLEGQEGVIKKHDFFTELCYNEVENAADRKLYYNGRKTRRICLVLDCLMPNDFSQESNRFMNLQHFVIKQQQLPEKLALVIYYNIVKVVAGLHEQNIVHRDLKLGNIVLHLSSKQITLTNFCLGKYLMNDSDLLRDQRGSPAYISPDVLSGKPYHGKSSDMWALGVVLFTMLYGQFPFYDVVPNELFNRIKAADFIIPDDGRVSEDTKSIIRRLLVVDPRQRLTAPQLQAAVEQVINVWRAIAPSPKNLQLVPEFDRKSSTGKRETSSSSHSSDLLLNLFHLNARSSGSNEDAAEITDKTVDSEPNLHGRIKVTRTFEDARPLTADEYRLYGPTISRMRQNNPSNISSTGRPLGRQEVTPSAAAGPAHVLVSSRSPLLATLRQVARQQGAQPPVPAAPSDAAVPVMEQDTVLDLSLAMSGEQLSSPRTTQRAILTRRQSHDDQEAFSSRVPQPAHSQGLHQRSTLTLERQRVQARTSGQEVPEISPRQLSSSEREVPLLLEDQLRAGWSIDQQVVPVQLGPHRPVGDRANASDALVADGRWPRRVQLYRLLDDSLQVCVAGALQWIPDDASAEEQERLQLGFRLLNSNERSSPRLELREFVDNYVPSDNFDHSFVRAHRDRPEVVRQQLQAVFQRHLPGSSGAQQEMPQNLASHREYQPHSPGLNHVTRRVEATVTSSSGRREELRSVLLEPPLARRQDPQAVQLREALMRMQVRRSSSEGRSQEQPVVEVEPRPQEAQSSTLRDALMRMNPGAVARSDEIIERSQRVRSREAR